MGIAIKIYINKSWCLMSASCWQSQWNCSRTWVIHFSVMGRNVRRILGRQRGNRGQRGSCWRIRSNRLWTEPKLWLGMEKQEKWAVWLGWKMGSLCYRQEGSRMCQREVFGIIFLKKCILLSVNPGTWEKEK